MTEQEAYDELARRIRATMSARKLELYAEIRRIESFDELNGYDLVRAAGWYYPAHVGDSTVRATEEQRNAFKIYRNNSEWRAYIDEVIGLLTDEGGA